jgi:hypothetical protein
MKYSVLALLCCVGSAMAAPPPPSAPAPTVAQTQPQSLKQTSRAQAMKQMVVCQGRASQLRGAQKQEVIDACMKGH